MGKKKLNKAQIGTALKPITAENVSDFFSLFSIPQKAITKLITGKYQAPSEAMGIKNKAGAIATDVLLDPINLIGGAGAVKATGVYKNAYKLNPFAEKLVNSNKSYRVAGRDAFDDFVESGVVRSYTPMPKPGMSLAERLGQRPTAFPSFQKGYADLGYLPKKGGVVFETGLPTYKRGQQNPVTGEIIKGRHYAHRVIDPKTGATLSRVPGDDIKVYEGVPHWLMGHKEIKVPKKKKDGGWLDKYDAPKAENGIEGTMDGLTDQGFNYNGAWGGTMQMGGNLPGAVGFTYARTAGAAPSNGPYAKKTKASAQDGGEMKFYQEGLDWKPKNISQDGTSVKKPRTDMLTMDEYRLQQSLADQPVIQSPKGKQLSKEEINKRNKEYAQQTGKKFDEKTGKVSSRFSPQQEKTLKKVEENILLPMLELESASGLGKLYIEGANKLAELIIPGLNYIDNKVVNPILYRKQIAELKKLHELAPQKYSSGAAADRLNQVLGINPSALEQPTLTFDAGEGSYYDSGINTINMDLRQVKRLTKSELTSPKAVYEHEYGHFLQREADRFSDNYVKDLARYEEQLAKYNDPENLKMLNDPEVWLYGKNRDKVIFNPGLRPQPYANPTKIDNYAMNLYEDVYDDLAGVKKESSLIQDLPDYQTNASSNIDYFYHRGVEPMAHLREMRQNMLEKKYIRDIYEPISESTIDKFIKENPSDRISSFTPSTSAKHIQGLEKIFRNLPVAVPAVGVGAASALEQKKKGGEIKKDDMGYWNPENWGEPVEIDSNEITMEGVYEPLIGISDTGDVQYMEPGEEYEFDGESVTEYPVANWLDKYN